MAKDFITVNRYDNNAIFANELASIPQSLRNLVNALEKVQQTGYRMFTTDPLDFSLFEQKHGLPAGAGQAVFDLVNGTLMALKGQAQNANAVELMNRVG